MKNILIIGCGNIGKRYIQSLNNMNDIQLYLVDPYCNFDTITSNHTVSSYKQVNDLPQLVYDMVIITTCSNIRYSILESLVTNYKVLSLILEKVLFQKIEEYELAKKLLDKYKIPTWVHTPRRTYPIYNYLKNKYNIQKMIVKGSNWGLACNSVHFIDLYHYLSDQKINNYHSSDILIVPSKRSHFYEIFGSLESKNKLLLQCDQSDDFKLEKIFITDKGEEIIVINDKGKYTLKEQENTKHFQTPMASEMIHLYVSSILEKQSSNLPTYDESMNSHLPFIKTLTNIFKENKIEGCPIT